MKKILFGLFTAWAVSQAAAAEGNWLTDLPKSLEQAKAEKKVVLVNFTGSDWCGWCKRLDKEVFTTTEFKEYATKNLVLVEADFPERKKQSSELKKANDGLKNKYKVDGFPTLVVLNDAGREIGRQDGYLAGGPKAFIAKLESFKKK
jgi:thioredoxin-related protein